MSSLIIDCNYNKFQIGASCNIRDLYKLVYSWSTDYKYILRMDSTTHIYLTRWKDNNDTGLKITYKYYDFMMCGNFTKADIDDKFERKLVPTHF